MLRSFLALAPFCVIALAGILTAADMSALAARQNSQAPAAASSQKTEKTQKTRKNEKNDKKETDKKEIDKNQKITAEQVAESTIIVYGSRPVLAQIRRNGVERGRITRFTTDGKTEETTYERRFVRGENAEKDKIRLDQKLPTMEYSLIFGEGRLWGLINGAAFTPRQDAAAAFLSQQRHSIETLLRYKENDCALNLIGKEKQKGLDLYVLDLTDKEKRTTRYFISARTLHVLWLEYEEPNADGTQSKYTKRFFDYRNAQSTLVPYRTVLLEDGKQTQETRVLTVTFGVKVDDSLFQNPQA